LPIEQQKDFMGKALYTKTDLHTTVYTYAELISIFDHQFTQTIFTRNRPLYTHVFNTV